MSTVGRGGACQLPGGESGIEQTLKRGETSQNSGYEKDPPGAGGKEKGPLCKVPQGPGGYAAGRGGQGEH